MNLTAECNVSHKFNQGKMEDRTPDPPSIIGLVWQHNIRLFSIKSCHELHISG